jgi:TonB family protein
MSRRFLMVFLAAIVGVSSQIVGNSLAQAPAESDTPQSRVLIAKLSRPIYPPVARQAAITGAVKVMLRIRRDGSVESAAIESGHPLLQQAALESAQQSQFECRECGADTTSYLLVYSFHLADTDCNDTTNGFSNDMRKDGSPLSQVIQSQNEIIVIEPRVILCDPVATVTSRKVRSARCLYLWRCGSRPAMLD